MNSVRIGCVTKVVYDDETASLRKIVKDNKIDLLVFPEMHDSTNDLGLKDLIDGEPEIVGYEMNWAKDLDCAMIMGMIDEKGTIFNVFVNPKAKGNETKSHIYIKHTMTDYSAFEWDNYSKLSKRMFQPVLFHDWRVGMTICYDSNFPIFSRMYGKQGIDLIVNNTWKDANKSKWFKYHKVRSIENQCVSVVTMFCDESTKSSNLPTYCFNKKGGIIQQIDCIEGIYVYEIEIDKGVAEEDEYFIQEERSSKNVDLRIPVGHVEKLIEKSYCVDKNIYCYHSNNRNVIFCIVKGNDILKPEKILPLFYNKNLDSIENKCFVIVNQYNHFSDRFYRTQLETILKVRAVENLCAVILESDNVCRCYQCTNYKNSQIVKPINGYFGLDLKRTHGPKHTGLHKSKQWNSNIEFLVSTIVKK